MKLSRKNVFDIATAAIGGAAIFASCSFLNAVLEKKLAFDIHVEAKNLEMNDQPLLVFLGELNREYYTLDPVACNKIVKFCDDLVKIRALNEPKGSGLSTYRLIKIYLQRLIDIKKPNKDQSELFANINNLLKTHVQAIHAQ